MMYEEWIKVSQAAKILSCSADSIRKWCDDGKINFIRTPGGHRLISLKSLEKLSSGVRDES